MSTRCQCQVPLALGRTTQHLHTLVSNLLAEGNVWADKTLFLQKVARVGNADRLLQKTTVPQNLQCAKCDTSPREDLGYLSTALSFMKSKQSYKRYCRSRNV